MRLIYYLLFGQFVSTLGSTLTRFALGVWVYEETGSATLFAMIAVCSVIPTIVIGPFAGAAVDRYDRRLVLILSDLGSALTSLVVIGILLWGDLQIWHILAMVCLGSLSESFQTPAWMASTTLMAPQEQWGRVSGLAQASMSTSVIVGPLLAGYLMEVVALETILFIDLASFVFALFTLLTSRIPSPQKTTANTEKTSMLQEFRQGWHFVKACPGLPALLYFFTAINFAASVRGILLTPMVLDFSTPARLGIILSGVGVGMLAGSLLQATWGGPKRYILGVMIPSAVLGLSFVFQGIRPLWWLVMISGGLGAACLPLINGSSQVIWQKMVPPELQGRVFSLRRMVAWSANPIAFVLAGILTEHLFSPAMVEGGTLARIMGPMIGVGPSRGAGLLFVIQGILLMGIVLLAWQHKPLRMLGQAAEPEPH